MSIDVHKGVTVRLFIGTIVTPDLKSSLDKSSKWSQAVIANETSLTEIRYRNKPYIGTYLDSEKVKILEICNTESEIRNLLQQFCPNQNCELLKMVIFPQIFLT